MRDIEFRGRDKKTGKWVFGHYFVDVEQDGDMDRFIKVHYIMTPYGDHYQQIELDPETVGQYTGLLDRNGMRIFESDIVRYKGMAFPVRWDIEKAGFFVSNDKYWMMNGMDIEVIGNIYDNSELLEERNE